MYGFVGYAEQGADVIARGNAWVNLPGAAFTFTLPRAMNVRMRGHGSVGASTGATMYYTFCGFRFLVDGAGQGDASWGDQWLVVNARDGSDFDPWYIERELSLGQGPHTVQVQMTGWTPSDAGCFSGWESYRNARLWIEAR